MIRYCANKESRIEKVSRFLGTTASYAIMVLIGFLTLNVVMRYFLRRPIASTEEITEYLLCFIVFIGMAYTMQVGAHVITNILVRHLSERGKEVLAIIRNSIGLVFSILLAVSAWELTIKNYTRGNITYGALGMPTWIPNTIYLVGSTVFFLEMILLFKKSVRRGSND